ncbi:antA/AntB antirepressor family protein [uncultured Ruminococcus sp.]|uniref:antA/AntB antirepressor family protein n=1 Tax=uncultured Ruminococcus sp. TaxID=165186 RepID=UPI002676F720|nr:antA/AntB antirepressor family protein [uncultured Ruminococcus sp.]
MKDLIQIHYDNADRPTVSGRELHEALGVETPYTTWVKRMCEYGFSENVDFATCFPNLESENQHGGQNKIDHQLTIPMAKELCMLQRTDKGKQMRQYFIAVEEQWNSPDAIMARALQLSNAKLKEMQITVSTLTVENQIMKPKAEYFDELVDRNLLTGIRETAGELGVKQNQFVAFLLEKKYMYRDKKGKLTAYAKPLSDGLFERKECMNEKTQWKGTQDLVTPKGRETFRLLMVGA